MSGAPSMTNINTLEPLRTRLLSQVMGFILERREVARRHVTAEEGGVRAAREEMNAKSGRKKAKTEVDGEKREGSRLCVQP